MAMTFVWPTDTKRVTSGFRTKARPDHHGVDIADPGVRPIYAAADGTVSRSYTSTSYGEVIFILHNINGQTWETVYAHLREGSRGYLVGDKVKQGARIGTMGNTGRSYGQHLHFELHRGRWEYYKKVNAVDPEKFLEKDLYPSNPWLKNGSEGPEVTEAQNNLITLGYKLRYGADGKFGDETDAAVRAFQREAKITVDGIVGPQTLKAFEEALAANQTKTLYLPAVESWRVYDLNVAPVKGNEKAFLRPAKFGGLTYEILGNPQKDVYTIQTRDFGKVNIYAAPSTGATIK